MAGIANSPSSNYLSSENRMVGKRERCTGSYKDCLKFYIKPQNYKQFLVPILVMFGIYLLGISSILRANVSYEDDIDRAISGYKGWGNLARWLADLFSMLLNGDDRLTDLSPLPQILAAFFLAVSSVMLVYILCRNHSNKLPKLALLASIPLGLSPYFLQCISYKFDAPYMALSILASIIPFLFIKNRILFVTSSVIFLLIMCLTYQASSGIYIMLTIALSLQYWLAKEKTYKEIFTFLLTAALSYIATLLLFFVNTSVSMPHVSTDITLNSGLFLNILDNFKQYASLINTDFADTWKVLALLAVACFIATTTILSKRNKFTTILVSTAIVLILFVSSFGAYLIFETPFLFPRGMYGVGIFIAVIGIFTVSKKWFAIPSIILAWCFFGFAFSFGNALADQKRYNDFRTEILLHDLSTLYPNSDNLQIIVKGTTGFSPVVKNVAVKNPIVTRLIDIQLEETGYYGCFYLINHYNFNLTRNRDGSTDGFNTMLLDSRYHTIKSDGKQALVILK